MKEREKKALLIVGGIVLAILIVAGIYTIVRQQKQIEANRVLVELEREMLEDEYNELALQYEGFRIEVSNDSLAHELASEQAKVQRLQEELRTVKSTDAARIAELKRELETLRKVLRSYVVQIDSLNRANEALRTENQEVRRQIDEVTIERGRLRQEKERLTEQVTLASKLQASGFRLRTLNSRGRETDRISRMTQLEFNFNIDSNVTAEPGYRDVYLRLVTPDEVLLTQPGVSGTFPFEGGDVPYSAYREIEYGGEQMPVTIYWDIREYLSEGTYRVELFADGYVIGRFNFEL